ncbi:MAG: hypothetical protein ACD_21C00190G0002 [uncultured bacterium]|nr:MAG: hypothetical protein ACD_21C00190G0002 [uncultured bacterium]
MELSNEHGSDKTISGFPIGVIPVDIPLVSVNDCKTKSEINIGCLNQTNRAKKTPFLNVDVMRKMIQRFLFEKKMSKEKLAQALGIIKKDIELLAFEKGLLKLAPQINLPLIKLYCKTRWCEKRK